MKYLKTIIFGASLALVAIAMPGFLRSQVNIAHAQDDCSITSADIAQITAIQNNSNLSYSEELQQELALRKQLVGETITCAQQDVQALQVAVASTTVDANSQALQSQFLGDLNDATNYYNIELTKLNESGIAGTQVIAKEVLEWREDNFAPLAQQTNNFILWSQNQALFDTAQTRMDQTSRAVAFLEGASENTDLQNAFDASLADFSTAQTENAAAKSSLSELSSGNQSLMLIKQSLDSLSTTYQDFSNISTIIKSILPQ